MSAQSSTALPVSCSSQPVKSAEPAGELQREACREDLQEALEGWLLLGLRLGHAIPQIDGIDLMAPLRQEAA